MISKEDIKEDNQIFLSCNGCFLVYIPEFMCYEIIYKQKGKTAKISISESQFYKMGRTELFVIVEKLKQEVQDE